MAITSADIKIKLPATVNDTASNGGRTSNTVVSSFFPNITGAERLSGITRYRKAFLYNEQSLSLFKDLTLYNGQVYLQSFSPGEDYYRLKAGTASDVQSAATGYTGWSGVGILASDITPGTTDFDVVSEAANGFEDGSTVIISDGTNTETLTLTSKSWVSLTASLVTSGVAYAYARYYDSKTATIYTDSTIGSNLANYAVSYEAKLVHIVSGTGAGQYRRIASNTSTTLTVTFPFAVTPSSDSVYEIIKTYVSQPVALGDIVASSSAWTEVSTSGSYDEGAYPLLLYPVGAVDQNWTLTFDNPATTYSIAGSFGLGTVISNQSIAQDCKPINGTSYYFNIRALGWGGTWAPGETITFTTVGSYKSFWCKQIVAAVSASCGDNTMNIICTGDTA